MFVYINEIKADLIERKRAYMKKFTEYLKGKFSYITQVRFFRENFLGRYIFKIEVLFLTEEQSEEVKKQSEELHKMDFSEWIYEKKERRIFEHNGNYLLNCRFLADWYFDCTNNDKIIAYATVLDRKTDCWIYQEIKSLD